MQMSIKENKAEVESDEESLDSSEEENDLN